MSKHKSEDYKIVRLKKIEKINDYNLNTIYLLICV